MSQGKEFAVALLARGTNDDWSKLSKEKKEDLALDIFDMVDKDNSGSVDKSELFESLAHGSVPVPHSIIETLFETLDINGDGEITEDEWVDNFEVYLRCLTESSSKEKSGKISTPRGPMFLKNGVRGTASERTNKGLAEGPRARVTASEKAIKGSSAVIQRSSVLKARRASDTAATTPPSVCGSTSDRSSLSSTRRFSVQGTEASPMTSPTGKQSERGIGANKKKNAHFIIGHTALNKKADTDAFKAKLVRRRSLKALLAIFKDINVRENGTISRQEFEHYLRWKAPDLLPHAKGIYAACTVRNAAGTPKTTVSREEVLDDVLDFTQMLRVLYPAASAEDVKELLKLLNKPKKPKPADWSEKVKECKSLFQYYNVSLDGWMTPDEFADGMERIGMDDDEVEANYNELFPHDHCGPVNFAEFFQWYTSHPLPEEFAHESVKDDSDNDE